MSEKGQRVRKVLSPILSAKVFSTLDKQLYKVASF